MGKHDQGDRILHISLLLLCLVPLVLSFFLSADGKTATIRFPGIEAGFGLQCVFKSITGYRCPACGLTRCFIYMSSLKIKAAWDMSKAGVFLYLFFLLQLPYRLLLLFHAAIPGYRMIQKLGFVHLITTGLIALGDFLLQFV